MTCISTDSVMLCRRLGAAGLYGNPQERKGPGSRQGGGGRGREGALSARALSAEPARAWARPGPRRPRRKLPLPFPLLLSPCVTGRPVWERPRSTRIFEPGVGEGRAAAAVQRKTKSASCSRLFDMRLLPGGARWPRPCLALPPLKT